MSCRIFINFFLFFVYILFDLLTCLCPCCVWWLFCIFYAAHHACDARTIDKQLKTNKWLNKNSTLFAHLIQHRHSVDRPDKKRERAKKSVIFRWLLFSTQLIGCAKKKTHQYGITYFDSLMAIKLPLVYHINEMVSAWLQNIFVWLDFGIILIYSIDLSTDVCVHTPFRLILLNAHIFFSGTSIISRR